MKCPRCEEYLGIVERKDVEIDVCPKCRGVWLDRGELDKIIERSERHDADRHRDDDDDRRRGYDPRQGHDPRQGYDPRYQHGSHHKKKSFWQELFD